MKYREERLVDIPCGVTESFTSRKPLALAIGWFRHINNHSGHIHIIGVVMMFLALFGAWHLYQGYQKDMLRDDVQKAFADYKEVALKIVATPKERDSIKNAISLQEVEDIVKKYRPLLSSTPNGIFLKQEFDRLAGKLRNGGNNNLIVDFR